MMRSLLFKNFMHPYGTKSLETPKAICEIYT
ncbi:hypothetical protein Gotri_001077 [Gossypium trilobum]|uniref:Uncharacterized protein n=1 Tax=Gossypium trilobum TaxID=34281 RepID=A0A7J9FDU7_9ROSI|nr:hypothetical protein [Gossypium trilobum]